MENFINDQAFDTELEEVYNCEILYKACDTFIFEIKNDLKSDWEYKFTCTILFAKNEQEFKVIILPRNDPHSYNIVTTNFRHRFINDVLFIYNDEITYAVCIKYKIEKLPLSVRKMINKFFKK